MPSTPKALFCSRRNRPSGPDETTVGSAPSDHQPQDHSPVKLISEGKEGVRIGALTSLHDLASSPLLIKSYPALVQSAEAVGAYAHQVMGTLARESLSGESVPVL